MTATAAERPWLVTGAAGFLGSHVVAELVERGLPVVALDGLNWGRMEYLAPLAAWPRCTLALADIREPDVVGRVFTTFRPGVVLHLAALHYIPAAVADPALAVGTNVLGTQVLLSAAQSSGVERFFFASTGDIYAPSASPHQEDEPPGPFNIYGLTKLQGEQLVGLAARSRPEGCFVIGRLFNLYGPRETNPHFLPALIGQLRADHGQTLRLGNLWPRRDLVPVADAARAIVEATACAPPGVTTVNIASGVAVSMEQVVALIGELLGERLAVATDPEKVRPVERDHLQADVSRLRRLIGWAPHADLRRGLAELLAHEGLL